MASLKNYLKIGELCRDCGNTSVKAALTKMIAETRGFTTPDMSGIVVSKIITYSTVI